MHNFQNKVNFFFPIATFYGGYRVLVIKKTCCRFEPYLCHQFTIKERKKKRKRGGLSKKKERRCFPFLKDTNTICQKKKTQIPLIKMKIVNSISEFCFPLIPLINFFSYFVSHFLLPHNV